LVLPDCQVKPGNDLEFLKAIGNYIVAKKPDVVVNIGDFADMPSLSSYDIGKKDFEGRRYKLDVEASKAAMETLLAPLHSFNEKARKNKEKQFHPRLVLTLGNHENRINKVINGDPKLDGTISVDDLRYEAMGWEVYPFLEPIIIDGVAYCHYFVTGILGKPCSSAQLQLNKKHMSCISGHQQGLQIATAYRADGKRLTSVIAGSCYEHDEDYMGPQGNKHWRGILMLHEVNEGEFDLMPVSLAYLKRKYL
jgi:hypothetical protein